VPLLEKAVLLEPGNARTHAALADALIWRAEKARKDTPSSAQWKQGFTDAVEHARRATELRPDLASAYLQWGRCLLYLGKPNEAVVPLRIGVGCQPTAVELQRSLGEALLEAGHYQEAATYLENARLLAPNDPLTAQALERLKPHKKN
jgi:Flp pilus assembly protein TadD